jgi:hypothetical protein
MPLILICSLLLGDDSFRADNLNVVGREIGLNEYLGMLHLGRHRRLIAMAQRCSRGL